MYQKYSAHGLGVKPTKFAHEVISYLPKAGTLLDLGAGQGQDSRFFAQRGFKVTSTDLTPAALEISKTLAEKENLPITFREVDVSKKLPFKDGKFAVVYSHMALHYFNKETTQKIFAEISRVLEPGGILATLVNTSEDPETTDPDFKEIEPGFLENPAGIRKRYFSVSSMSDLTKDHFAEIILDNKGKTYKDDTETLIRFIGRKKE